MKKPVLYIVSIFFISCSHTSKTKLSLKKQPNLIYKKGAVEKDFHFLLGNMHSYKNENYKASKHFQKALNHSKSSKLSEQNVIKINLAKEHLNNNLINKALPLLQEVVKTDPKNKQAWLLLSFVYLELEFYKESLDSYKILLKQNPYDQEVIKGYMLTLLKAKHYKKLFKTLSSYIKNPKLKKYRHEYYHIKALSYHQSDKKRKAYLIEKNLRSAVRLKPDFLPSVGVLNSLYNDKKQFKKQEMLLEKYLKAKKWSDLHIGLELLELYRQRKKNQKALKVLFQLKKAFPENKDLLFHKIILLVNMNQMKQALLEVEEFSKAYPKDVKNQQLFVFIYLKFHQLEKAIKTLSQLNKKHINYENALWMVVNHLVEKKKQKKALFLLKRNLKHFKTTHSFLHYGILLSLEREYKKSLKVIQKGLKEFPKDEELLFYMGNLHSQNGEFHQMVKTIEKVLELNPNHFQALNYLAYSLADKNLQIDRAFQMAKKALLLSPDNGYILDTVGWILYKKGEFREAKFYLEKAVKKEPKEALILEHLGDVYVQLNYIQKAIDIYKKALVLESDDERKVLIKNKLSSSLSKAESIRTPAGQSP